MTTSADTTDSTKPENGSSKSRSQLWAAQIRREFDILIMARQGDGTSSIAFALAVEAVAADTGMLTDVAGNPGFAWKPTVYENKGSKNPTADRIKSAGASLGRMLAGGHPDHRTYLAFMEAIYVVTTAQDYDVAARIEALWDQLGRRNDSIHDIVEQIIDSRPGFWKRIGSWLRRLLKGENS